MVARAIVASLALLAFAGTAYTQDAIIRINAAGRRRAKSRLTISDYESAVTMWETLRGDTELLYTDFDSRSSSIYEQALNNMTDLIQTTIRKADTDPHREGKAKGCWEEFEHKMKLLENNNRKAAIDIRLAHHKYIRGYKIVFNIHLNKTESILKRWDYYMSDCSACWTTPSVRRFHQKVKAELDRIRNDINFTRSSYIDLVSHSLKELNRKKRAVINEANQIVLDYNSCLCE